MMPEERKMLFHNGFQNALAVLSEQYGYTVESRQEIEGQGALAVVKAVLEIVPVPGWEEPSKEKDDEQDD